MDETKSHFVVVQLTGYNTGITLLFSRSARALLSSPLECQDQRRNVPGHGRCG